MFAAHNRHALFMALVSLLGAIFLWALIGSFAFLILLGILTSIHGEEGAAVPTWLAPTAGAIVVILFLWGSLDHWLRRYAAPTDRAIIGWHVIRDALLLPVRMTFAVWGNLTALVHLSRYDVEYTWWVLRCIQATGRVPTNSLGQIDSDLVRLERSVIALQMLGLLDLHQGAEGPFLLVRSDSIARLNQALLLENR
jgi:hypothetical protein